MQSTSSRHLSRTRASNGLPRGALWGAFALVALTVVLVFADQATDAVRGEQTATAPETRYRLTFAFAGDDSPGDDSPIVVSRAGDGRELAVLAADNSRFLRTVVSSLLDKRARADIPADAPFDLIRWSDGTMVLADPVNGHYMPLNGFGQDNERAFRQLLAAASDGA